MNSLCGPMTKEVWSKAVTLALQSIARMLKRDCAVIHFQGTGKLRVDRFPKGASSPSQATGDWLLPRPGKSAANTFHTSSLQRETVRQLVTDQQTLLKELNFLPGVGLTNSHLRIVATDGRRLSLVEVNGAFGSELCSNPVVL